MRYELAFMAGWAGPPGSVAVDPVAERRRRILGFLAGNRRWNGALSGTIPGDMRSTSAFELVDFVPERLR